MKILSVTQGNGRAVEMTEQEFREFSILAQAGDGASLDEARHNFAIREMYVIDDEISYKGTFGAIKAFYDARFKLNELRKLVDTFQRVMNE